ncbi:MAG: SDR family oxidoreductase [Rhodospirillales bacterium]|nr:SDR family oxidoreductase [Rhodospirillales bacterium]
MTKTINQLMNLKGRVALVTGGAGHIGIEAARALAELGADVVLADMDYDKCKGLTDQISKEYGVNTFPLALDLGDDQKVRASVAEIVEAFGRLDILVNSAAFVGTTKLEGWGVPFEDQSADTWRQAMDINLTSIFVLCQAATPHLKASGHGSIINISSIYGMTGPDMRLYEGLDMGNPAAYGASKGGLLQFTRWLSTTLAPEIRVNAMTPGGIFRNQNEMFVERYNQHTPLKRMGTEEDMKGAIAYLAGDLSAYVTGQNIVVDGGWTAW